MSYQQKPFVVNGAGRRRDDKDGGSGSDNSNWRQSTRTTSNFCFEGGSKGNHERLLYMHTCLIGQHVEVQKIDGKVYSGIFHAAIMDKEFGVVLKMARLTKEGAQGIQGESVRQAAWKRPIRSYVIHGKDFVQIIVKSTLEKSSARFEGELDWLLRLDFQRLKATKDASLSGDALSNSRARENRSDVVTDAVLSQGWHREFERELKPWKPDDESSDSKSFNLSNMWSSESWDQFETNKALFGVETTFDEELYTTKLLRGPQMREREREAQRIAREIVGQQTHNMHLAEERGVLLSAEIETLDEETKYSSVGRGYEDVGGDDDDQHRDDHNEETFGANDSQISSCNTPFPGQTDDEESSVCSADLQIGNEMLRAENLQDRQVVSLGKEDADSPDSFADSHDGHLILRKLLVGEKSKHCYKGPGSPYNSPIGRGSPLMSPVVGDPAGIKALNLDPSCPQVPDDVYREFKEFKQQKQLEALKALSESFKKELEPRSPSTSAGQDTAHALGPRFSSSPFPVSISSSDRQPSIVVGSLGLVCVISRSATSGSCSSVQTSGSFLNVRKQEMVSPTISSSSSTGCLPSASAGKKSALNLYAKDFKLNPNAKAFTPSSCSSRPTSSVAQPPVVVQSPVFLHSCVPAVASIQGSQVNLQMIAQQKQVRNFSPYNHAVAAAVVAVNSTQYMQPGGSVPGFPVGGGGILPGQPHMRVTTHSQQQAVSPCGHPQQVKYPPPSPPMQSGFLHPNCQLYSQHMMYGQPPSSVVYMQYPQVMMHGHPLPSLGQGHLCSPSPQRSQSQFSRQGDMRY